MRTKGFVSVRQLLGVAPMKTLWHLLLIKARYLSTPGQRELKVVAAV
jgi:hypothetical protein